MNPSSSLPLEAIECNRHSWLDSAIALGLTLGFLLASATSTSAQTWESVSPDLSGGATGVVCDSTGAVYVCGQLRISYRDVRAVILKNSNRAGIDDWTTSFISNADAKTIYFRAITTGGTGAAQGELFALAVTQLFVTRTVDSGFVRGWDIYRSTDSGLTWLPINDAPFDAGFWSQEPYGIAADSTGNVYVVGYAEERIQGRNRTTSYYHSLVRKGTRIVDGGGNVSYAWKTVAELKGGASGVTCIGTTVFVAGGGDGNWQVNKSTDGGVTWNTIDVLSNAGASQITSDSSENLIVIGNITKKNTSYIATRIGTKFGNFQTVDSAQAGGASAVTVVPSSGVFVTGSVPMNPGYFETVRQGTKTNAVWSWVQVDSLPSTVTAHIEGIASDSAGNVYTVGRSPYDETSKWMVRRLLVPLP